jgi:hypothetical protein
MPTYQGDAVTDLAALNLRATAAMRDEDARIARKHFVEAAARKSTPENVAAYHRALSWWDVCNTRSQQAHAALIRHMMAVPA